MLARNLVILAVLIAVALYGYLWRPSRAPRKLTVREIGLLLTVLALFGLASAAEMLSKAGDMWILISLLAFQLAAILWVVPKGKRLVPTLCALGSSSFAWISESMVTHFHVRPGLGRVPAVVPRLALPLYVVSFSYIMFYLALTMKDLLLRMDGQDHQ